MPGDLDFAVEGLQYLPHRVDGGLPVLVAEQLAGLLGLAYSEFYIAFLSATNERLAIIDIRQLDLLLEFFYSPFYVHGMMRPECCSLSLRFLSCVNTTVSSASKSLASCRPSVP